MADVSRRGFLTQMSITTGVGIAGGLGLHKLLGSGAPSTTQVSAPTPAVTPASALAAVRSSLEGITLAGPMVVHVRDLATAEVAMMVGTQEVIYRDPELVSRLVKTAGSVNRAEG